MSITLKVNVELAKREMIARNAKYRESFKDFCTHFFKTELNKEFIWNWHHQVQLDALEDLMQDDEQEVLLLNVHPGSGKTEIVSKLYPIWKMGNDGDFWFIDVGYSADLTMDFSGDARGYVESLTYGDVFPSCRLDPKQKSRGFWKTSNGSRFYAVGCGGTITGKRGDLIALDDPTNPKDILSKHQLDKTNDWFNMTLKSRRRAKYVNGELKRGKIVVMMQRLHDNDICGYLRREHKDKFDRGVYKIVAIPAIAVEDDEYREKGEAMFPQMFPLSYLNNEKETSMKDIGMNHFSAQYQQDPVDAENAEFKRDFFRYYAADDLTKKQLQTAIGVDTAFSQRESADFRSIVTVSKSTDAEFFVRSNIYGRFSPGEFMDKIFQMVEVFPRSPVILEKSGNDWFIELLKKEMVARSIFFTVMVIPSRGEKESRLRTTLEPLYSNFRIFHREEDKYGQLEDEIVRFPRSAHDDNMDALETAISRFSFNETKKASKKPDRSDIDAARLKRSRLGL